MSRNERIRRIRRRAAVAVGIVLTALLLLGLPFPAAAHSPGEVRISYDAAKRTLTVWITHDSGVPDRHYIKKVEIKKNGKPVIATEYKSQSDQETFSYTYQVSAAAGDVLEVTATCSIFGSRTEKLDMRDIPR